MPVHQKKWLFDNQLDQNLHTTNALVQSQRATTRVQDPTRGPQSNNKTKLHCTIYPIYIDVLFLRHSYSHLYSQPPAVVLRILGEFGDLDTIAPTYTEEEAAVMMQV